jgi:hypothetical protein
MKRTNEPELLAPESQAHYQPPAALATRQDTALAVRDPESILRYAVDKGANVEVIERLMVVREKLKAEQAKEAFDSGLAAFQSECPIIEKSKAVMNKDGRSVRYKFAPLDSIVTQVKAILQRHGFSYSLTAETQERTVKAICKVTHCAGHSQLSEFAVPIDPEAFMNAQQKFAAALTFAKRYAFCNAFGILTGDEDTDGRMEKEKPKGPMCATEKTRAWFLQQIADIKEQAHAYAIDKGYVMPDEPLDAWALDSVPVSKADLDRLRKDILK